MITDLRINAKGELEGKVIPPVKWEEMYTKDEVVAMLTELQQEIEDKAIRKQGIDSGFEYNYEFIQSEEVVEIIQQKINSLKAEIEPQAEKEQTDD